MINDNLEESYHVNMIINLLVRYPDIFTIKFNLSSSSCCLTYMINRKLNSERYKELQQTLEDHLEAYQFLRKKKARKPLLRKKIYRGLTRLEIILQDESLPGEEIGMITSLMRDLFKADLLSEIRPEDSDIPDETPASLEDILELLLSCNRYGDTKNLFAFRDAGKVYVFDK